MEHRPGPPGDDAITPAPDDAATEQERKSKCATVVLDADLARRYALGASSVGCVSVAPAGRTLKYFASG